MNSQAALIVAGAALGLFLGSSMGIAFGGTAYNAAWFFLPLGGFIGWLISRKPPDDEKSETDQTIHAKQPPMNQQADTVFTTIVLALLKIMASVWNFQIDILEALGILPTFVRQPLLFAGLCLIISAIFPPFFVLYFLAWLGANHFGISEETNFRADIP